MGEEDSKLKKAFSGLWEKNHEGRGQRGNPWDLDIKSSSCKIVHCNSKGL